MQKATNSTWGLMERARVEKLRKRLYLMDTIVRAGFIYGAEVWGWSKRIELESAQGKFIKMVLGVNANTPDYIWAMESRKFSLEIEARRRAGNFLKSILEMMDN